MQEIKDKHIKLAKISLIVCHVLTIIQLLTIYQTKRQIVSPLIPRSTIDQILDDSIGMFGMDYILTPIIFSVVTLIAVLVFFYKKYSLVIAIGAILLIAHFGL